MSQGIREFESLLLRQRFPKVTMMRPAGLVTARLPAFAAPFGIAERAAVDEWLRGLGPRADRTEPQDAGEEDDLEPLRRRLAIVHPSKSRRAG